MKTIKQLRTLIRKAGASGEAMEPVESTLDALYGELTSLHNLRDAVHRFLRASEASSNHTGGDDVANMIEWNDAYEHMKNRAG